MYLNCSRIFYVHKEFLIESLFRAMSLVMSDTCVSADACLLHYFFLTRYNNVNASYLAFKCLFALLALFSFNIFAFFLFNAYFVLSINIFGDFSSNTNNLIVTCVKNCNVISYLMCEIFTHTNPNIINFVYKLFKLIRKEWFELLYFQILEYILV